MSLVNINSTNFDENYSPAVFENTWTIDQMHAAPRFGHSSNVTIMANGSESEQIDYLIGLGGMSVLILSIFTVWLLTTIILKLCGKRAGCASGKASETGTAPRMPFIVKEADTFSTSGTEMNEMEMPGNPDVIEKERNEYETDVRMWKFRVHKATKQISRLRFFFMVCGLGNLVCTGGYLYFGIDSLRVSIDGAYKSIDQIQSLVNAGIVATESFILNTDDAAEKSTDLLATNEDWCPDNTNPRILGFKNEIVNISESVTPLVDATLVSELAETNAGLVRSSKKIDALKRDTNWVNIVFYAGMAVAFLNAIVTVALMGGVASAWAKGMSSPYRCVQSWFVLPLFVLLTFVSVVLSVVFVVSSTAFSDLCVDGPDAKAITFLEAYEDKFDPKSFEFMVYYVSGCDTPAPLSVNSYVPLLTTAAETTQSFIGQMTEDTIVLLTQLCGAETPLIVAITDLLYKSLEQMGSSTVTVVETFQCSSGNNIYTDLAYDAVCYTGIESMYYLYFCQLGVVLFSMLMVTIRVSWQEVEVDTLKDIDASTTGGEMKAANGSSSPKYPSKTFKKKNYNDSEENNNIEMNTIMGEMTMATGNKH